MLPSKHRIQNSSFLSEVGYAIPQSQGLFTTSNLCESLKPIYCTKRGGRSLIWPMRWQEKLTNNTSHDVLTFIDLYKSVIVAVFSCIYTSSLNDLSFASIIFKFEYILTIELLILKLIFHISYYAMLYTPKLKNILLQILILTFHCAFKLRLF